MQNGTLIKVSIAMILAVVAGWLTGMDTGIFGVTFYQIFSLVGQLFLNALTLVVVPLVTASIITGTAKIGTEKAFGSLGAKAFGYFLTTTFLAVLVGWGVSIWMAPGSNLTGVAPITNTELVQALDQQASETAFAKIEKIFLQIIPPNIIGAAAKGQMLGLILFSLLFGFFMTRIESQASSTLYHFWQGVLQTMMKITQAVMKLLPIGVFALVAKVAASTGLETLTSLAYFFLAVVVGLLLYICVILPILLKGIAGINPLHHFKAMIPALFTAFSTSSSAASLPVTFECMEKRAGVSNRICSFTLPLGTSFNMAGTALYECMAVFFIAQVYGIALPLTSQILIVALSFLTSIGIAGIPSASLIAIVVILSTMGLPTEGIGLLITVERLLDMLRTVTNVFSNSCCSVLVARSEGEETALALE